MTENLIHSYAVGQIGADNEWDMIINHVSPEHDESLFSTQIYIINPDLYDIDSQKMEFGQRTDAHVLGLQQWLLPKVYAELDMPVIQLAILNQQIVNPVLDPDDIQSQGIQLDHKITSRCQMTGVNLHDVVMTDDFNNPLQPLPDLETIEFLQSQATFGSGAIEIDTEAVDSITNTQSVGEPWAAVHTDTFFMYTFKEFPSAVDEVTLTQDLASEIAIPDAKDSSNSEQTGFFSFSWSLHNAYNPVDNSDMMEYKIDQIGEIPGEFNPLVDLDESIPILPLAGSLPGQSKEAIIQCDPVSDWRVDWEEDKYETAQQGTEDSLPVLSDISQPVEIKQYGYVHRVIKKGSVIIPPNIVIQ